MRAFVARIRLGVVSVIALTITLATASLANAQETRYIYDAVGRLIGVIDPSGQITIYDYDPVGNLLAIRRPEVATPVAITLVNPSVGIVGTAVEILGVGFSAIATENALAFNGVSATVITASANRLVTQVPAGATSGSITLTAPNGSAVSPSPFRVASIVVLPAATSVAISRQRQFSAVVAESTDQRVTWSVNGLVGGNATLGTIGVDGIYRAPVDLPVPPVVEIGARSVPFPLLFGAASVSLTLPFTALTAAPFDIRVVRPGRGDPGAVPLNISIAEPWLITTVRPGTGDPDSLAFSPTFSTPPFITAVRPGTGDLGALPLNVSFAAPPLVSVVLPGTGSDNGSATNITVASPFHVTAVRTGSGDAGGLGMNVVVAAPYHLTVRRP